MMFLPATARSDASRLPRLSRGAINRRTRVHETGALRVRFPNGANDALDAVLVNTAGGMTGGDHFNIDLVVGANARLTITTAAAEKVYRSLGADTRIDVTVSVSDGGTLAWLPQETILFNQARLRRSIDIDLAPGASLLLAEATIFGRSAMGETIGSGHFSDRWRIRVGGKLVFAENLKLDGNIAQCLAQRAVAGGGVAVASLIKIPGDEECVTAIRTLQSAVLGEVGASAWNGLAVVRFVATDGAALRRDLVSVLTALGGTPLPRLWLN